MKNRQAKKNQNRMFLSRKRSKFLDKHMNIVNLNCRATKVVLNLMRNLGISYVATLGLTDIEKDMLSAKL
jgi:hypothetical protein